MEAPGSFFSEQYQLLAKNDLQNHQNGVATPAWALASSLGWSGVGDRAAATIHEVCVCSAAAAVQYD
eukprot:8128-Heterococcus_DN1.PRE.2